MASAHQGNLAVIAAAGNEGGPILYPAAYPAILSVGAGDAGAASGALCSFASRGEGLDVIAPGCDSQIGGLEGAFEDDGTPAFGSGSSQASAIVSAVLASMRAYAPQLTYSRAEECLITTADNRAIDAAAAFDVCGLSQVVEEGRAVEKAASEGYRQKTSTGAESGVGQSASTVTCTPSTSCIQSFASGSDRKTRCPRPQGASIAIHHGHLVLRVRKRLGGCLLQVRLRSSRGYRWSTMPGRSSNAIRLPNRRPYRIEVRFVS